MKSLILFCSLLAVTTGVSPEVMEQMKAHMMKLGAECKGEVGAANEDIAPMLAHQPPNTPKGKCFVACMNKKMGFQDASGKLDGAGIQAWIDKLKTMDDELYQKMGQVARNCMGQIVVTPDVCETATNIFICVKKEQKAVGIEEIDFNS